MIAERFKELSVDEVANSLTHGFGLVLSVIGFVFLVSLAVYKGDALHIVSSVVYGASLVTLYAASTFYHSAISPAVKQRLQIVDHCCIYLLIAGSYTPFLLLVIRGSLGAGLLAVVWSMALFGIAMKVIFGKRFNIAGVVSYLAMGWIGIIAVQPLYMAVGITPLVLVLAGGIAYSLGVIFYAARRIPYHHAIFHVFVLAGSMIHYFAILLYVAP
ncbi:MAG TPA: hemolysin III family protein [Pyrinomonadaceae bacterium]|nr:hemolysin III family protein [Pyrinomonadaceae bacterium]HMP66191.1 hemolysin III family protein [Pyrinomonadaceae bacterium]